MQGYRACEALLQVALVPEEEENKCRSPDEVKRNPGECGPVFPDSTSFHPGYVTVLSYKTESVTSYM